MPERTPDNLAPMAYALSSDSHVMEPPDLWTGALGGDLADVAPRVEPGDDADWWVIGGQRMFSFSVATKAGLRFEGQDRLADALRAPSRRFLLGEDVCIDLDLAGMSANGGPRGGAEHDEAGDH